MSGVLSDYIVCADSGLIVKSNTDTCTHSRAFLNADSAKLETTAD